MRLCVDEYVTSNNEIQYPDPPGGLGQGVADPSVTGANGRIGDGTPCTMAVLRNGTPGVELGATD